MKRQFKLTVNVFIAWERGITFDFAGVLIFRSARINGAYRSLLSLKLEGRDEREHQYVSFGI